MRALTRDEVREIDRRAADELGLPTVVLMENAGRNAAELLTSQTIVGPVAIVCGVGNNAGDGFVIARHLANRGHDVRVMLSRPASSYRGDAAIMLGAWQRAGMPVTIWDEGDPERWLSPLDDADWIVDALLGTGATGDVRAPLTQIMERINQLGRRVFAVDLPSGMDCDTGTPLGCCIRATMTGTFVAPKIGFSAAGAAECTGPVHVLDIGVPSMLIPR